MKQRGKIRERVIRVLLNKPDGTLTKYRVAKEAECTFSWVHEFLGELKEMELVDGTKVTDYMGLVKYWLKVKTKTEKRGYMHRDPLTLLSGAGLQYALTTYQAENLVQHYLNPSRIDLYIVEEDAKSWDELITSEGLVGEGNMRLLLADKYVFYGSFERNGLKIVSLPQLIVDLLDEGGVCVEAAEKLLEKAVEHNVRAK